MWAGKARKSLRTPLSKVMVRLYDSHNGKWIPTQSIRVGAGATYVMSCRLRDQPCTTDPRVVHAAEGELACHLRHAIFVHTAAKDGKFGRMDAPLETRVSTKVGLALNLDILSAWIR